MTEHNQNPAYRLADIAIRAVLKVLPVTKKTEGAALWWGYRFKPAPRTVSLRSGMRFRYQDADFIPLLLYYLGTFEPHVIKVIRSHLKPGDIALDVGANVGFHTLECWKRVGKQGRVISIEAMPVHANLVKRNLQENGLPSTNVINVAVGDHDGEVTIGLPDGGNAGMFGVNAGSSGTAVPLRRIDDLLDVTSLALIKMDIEGSELDALKGAEQTIRRHKPVIVIELNETALARCGATSNAVIEHLNSLGYFGKPIENDLIKSEDADCIEWVFLPV